METINTSNDELERIVELSYLYDFYGALLKEKNQEIFEDYVLNDLSLGEIAAEREITRQGVYDVVRRCSMKLFEYEKKLHLVEKFRMTREKMNEIEQIAMKCDDTADMKEILRLTHDIYDFI